MTTAPVTARAVESAKPDWGSITLRWLPLLALGVAVYGSILARLSVEWLHNEDYSHGLIVLPAIAYLVHLRREQLSRIPVRPSGWGLAVIVMAQVVNVLGVLGAELFLQRISFVFLAAGVLLYLYGWQWLRALGFALALLALAIPLPAIVFNSVALPLQFFASSMAEHFLQLCSIPVYREGNVLVLATQSLNVAEACSGIRSLISLISLALMISYLVPLRSIGRAFLVLSGVPIALLFNALRVGMTGVLAHRFGPRAAEGFFHSFSGWVMFVAAMFVLFFETVLLMKAFREKELQHVA